MKEGGNVGRGGICLSNTNYDLRNSILVSLLVTKQVCNVEVEIVFTC